MPITKFLARPSLPMAGIPQGKLASGWAAPVSVSGAQIEITLKQVTEYVETAEFEAKWNALPNKQKLVNQAKKHSLREAMGGITQSSVSEYNAKLYFSATLHENAGFEEKFKHSIQYF